jgi:quercetin dioxygenase-like cupin family protein
MASEKSPAPFPFMKKYYAPIFVSIFAAALWAQNTGVKRTIVERGDIAAPGREAVIVDVEIAPGASVGRHTHPGEEISYLVDGEAEVVIDGQAPRKIKTGDSFLIPAGKIHDFRNTGARPLKLHAVYVVEKGKPLSTPVPTPTP